MRIISLLGPSFLARRTSSHLLQQARTIRLTHTMSATNEQQQQQTHAAGPQADATATDKKKTAIPKGKREIKILMLHGYTQSGPLFSSKTKALAKLLTKALGPAPLNLHPTLIYPTAPHRLRLSDIPGYVPPSSGVDGDDGNDDDEASDNWGWFRKDEATGAYRGFEAGMHAIADAVRASGGPVDGVLGFSQGGAMAALVAAALEHPYRSPPPPPSPSPSSSSSSAPSSSSSASAADYSWVSALREANGGRALRFCVVYSGFYAPHGGFRWLYEDPPLATPSLHFLGGLDTVVDEARSRGLVERCRDPVVLVHPGGHYVPVAKDWVVPLVGWLRQRYLEEPEPDEEGKKDKKESA
ncbi:serine hydrolase-domain-containing protein [Biscogniauxia mediterranea]|nr:serine hydrolase-domain-containing protein [Biscogniauxia mediterranea]